MEADLIEYEAKSTLYIQGIGEIRAGQTFKAPRSWVEVLRYVARPLPPGRVDEVGGGGDEPSPPSFARRRKR